VGQVGGRQAFVAAAVVELDQRFALVRQQARVEEGFEPVERQVQRVQRQVHGFVPGVVAAVAEE